MTLYIIVSLLQLRFKMYDSSYYSVCTPVDNRFVCDKCRPMGYARPQRMHMENLCTLNWSTPCQSCLQLFVKLTNVMSNCYKTHTYNSQ